MRTVVVAHSINRELAPLKGALAALGYDVAECGSAAEVLQFMSSRRAEAIVASACLPDLSGYQLACLVKSHESTKMLPIIMVDEPGQDRSAASKSAAGDDFAALANRCRMMVEVSDSPQALKMLQTLLPRPEPVRGSLSGALSKSRVSSYEMRMQQEHKPDTESILHGTADMLNQLLIEKIVSEKVAPLLSTVDSRGVFSEHFFNTAKQLIDCSICGLIVACTSKPWGALKISSAHHYKKEGMQHWLKSIGEYSLEGLAIDFDVSGQLYDEGDALPVPATFEVASAEKENILGLLVFAPSSPQGFDSLSLKIIRCLQEKMRPIIQVRLDRERLADKERFPIVTDELTGAYNLDFLIGFIQQQLLFSFRQRTPLSLVLMQIDGIKEVNSKIGWEAGDHLLAQIATWLANHTRGSDIVSRCGGNTFAIVLPSTNIEGAATAAQKYVQDLASITNDTIPLRILTGCAVAKPAELNPEVLLRDAQDDLDRHRACSSGAAG